MIKLNNCFNCRILRKCCYFSIGSHGVGIYFRVYESLNSILVVLSYEKIGDAK